jgi:hypothetical protein
MIPALILLAKDKKLELTNNNAGEVNYEKNSHFISDLNRNDTGV